MTAKRPDRPSFDLPAEPPAQPVVPRDSSTVIVCRDGEHGLEVFMLERHLKSDFAGGAYVFPGGTLEERDCDPALAGVTDGFDGDRAGTIGAGDPARALGFYVCAIRETFEEAGVLLARGEDGRPADPSGERRSDARRALAAREITPLDFARGERLRLAADLLHYYARWVTPELAPRRYDARFFVAAMPEGADALHDDVETTASRWIRPTDALDAYEDGTFTIIFPTRKTLESLTGFHSAEEVVNSCRGKRVATTLPSIVIHEGEPRVVLPGFPGLHRP